MTHVTCRLTAKNRDQLRNPRSVIEYGLPFFTSVTVTGTASIHAEFMSQLGHEMGAGDASDD